MGVILFGIYIVLSIMLTVIGVFIGNIIFFDSILLAALSGLLCHTLWTVHPAFYLLIGIAVFLLLFWLQHTGVGVCEKGCCLAVTSLLSLGYSIFELTCLPSALKSVDFTGFLLVFLCQRS